MSRALALALAAAGALLVLMLPGCGPAQATPAPPGVRVSAAATPGSATAGDAEHELGRKVWNFRCYFCHGYSGDARTLAASYLWPKPRDFTDPGSRKLTLPAMREAIAHGRPGTAMKAFESILSPREIDAVAGFVRREFIRARAENTRYHTAANGWPGHERYAAAFPFARGELARDAPWEHLSPDQQRGKRLFMTACITCHDHARVQDGGPAWETRALSYPRDAYCTSCHDQPNGGGRRPLGAPPAGHPPIEHADRRAQPVVPARRGERVAATYRVHDTPPQLRRATALERRGETLYQANCAFCHAADGTAKSWIGRFLEPHPRDLTDPAAMAGMTRARLRGVIEDGLEGSSMPGWKYVLAPRDIDALVAYIHRAFHALQ